MLTMPPGRPREFDKDKAVAKAMEVFWARGYEGASIAELTSAMGISKPSLYAAFRDKRGLFTAALECYTNGPRGFGAKSLTLRRRRNQWQALLTGVVEVSTHRHGPKGCLFTHAALACSADAEPIRDAMSLQRLMGEKKLLARLEQGREAGEFPKKCDLPAAYEVHCYRGAEALPCRGPVGHRAKSCSM